MINGHGHPGMTGEGAEAADLLRCDDLVGHQHISEAVSNEHLGLPNSADADAADGAASAQLLVGDRRTAMRLDVRSHLSLALAEEGMQGGDVAFQDG